MPKKYEAIINKLTPVEFDVTQNNNTEKAFENEYWDNKEPGIYVDIVSGDPLFSSIDKYDSGSGWPSFTKTLSASSVILKEDLSYGSQRIEVLTNTTHLGHLFEDGPKNTGGMRYCINSSSIKFMPKELLVESGYGEYLSLFAKQPNLGLENAYLAGGCFWGLEYLLSNIKGITDTCVGYCGGEVVNPTYDVVMKGNTGHAETVRITFKSNEISYREILKVYFTIHDPTTLNRQGNDQGTQYKSAIFYANDIQKYIALNLIEQGNQSGVFTKPIVTEVLEMKAFYEAESYHQKYLKHNPDGYSCHFAREEWKF